MIFYFPEKCRDFLKEMKQCSISVSSVPYVNIYTAKYLKDLYRLRPDENMLCKKLHNELFQNGLGSVKYDILLPIISNIIGDETFLSQ